MKCRLMNHIIIRKVTLSDAREYLLLINSVWCVVHQHIFPEEVFADLVALYIKPEYQHMGLGRRLKETFEKWARANECKSM